MMAVGEKGELEGGKRVKRERKGRIWSARREQVSDWVQDEVKKEERMSLREERVSWEGRKERDNEEKRLGIHRKGGVNGRIQDDV